MTTLNTHVPHFLVVYASSTMQPQRSTVLVTQAITRGCAKKSFEQHPCGTREHHVMTVYSSTATTSSMACMGWRLREPSAFSHLCIMALLTLVPSFTGLATSLGSRTRTQECGWSLLTSTIPGILLLQSSILTASFARCIWFPFSGMRLFRMTSHTPTPSILSRGSM
jgi:hypothetical protein